MIFFKILENPVMHNFCQRILSFGRGKALELTNQFLIKNCHGKMLDIGCGTGRYTSLFQQDYFALDVNPTYLYGKTQKGKNFICCNAEKIPFKDSIFDTIFSIGFFHHANPESTTIIFREIIRISKKDANILIVDSHYPNKKFDLACWLLSKFDRGRYFRSQQVFMKELQNYFEVINYEHIKHSYPYNLNAYLLKVRQLEVI